LWENWYQVAGRFDASNVYLFVNGVQVASAALGGTITKSAAEITIGSNTNSAPNEFYDGSIALPLVYYTYKDDAAMLALGTARQPNDYDKSGMQVGIPLNKGVSSGLEAQNVISANGDAILTGSPLYNGEPITFDSVPQEPPVAPPEASYNMMEFAGGTDNIDCGNVLDFGDTDFAFSGYFYIDPAQTDTRNYILSRYGSSANNVKCYMLRYNQSSGELQWITQTSTTVSSVSSAINEGQLYHFYCYFDSTANEMGLAVDDGTPVTAAATSINSGGTVDFRIGSFFDSTDAMEGSISSIAAYNTLLTDAEQTTVYATGKSLYYETLPTSITDKVESYWELSSRDATANDLKGSNNGIITGATATGELLAFTPYDPVAEASYNTFLFDGTAKDLSTSSTPFHYTTSFSVSTWVIFDQFVENFPRIVDCSVFQPGTDYGWWLGFDDATSDLTFVGVGLWGTSDLKYTLTADTLYHIIAEYDSVTGTAKLFVDGAEVASHSGIVGSLAYSDISNLGVGNRQQGQDPTEWLDGELSNISIHPEVLSTTNKAALYNGGKIPYQNTLPTISTDAFWELSSRDNSGNDLSGNNRNLVASGGVTSDGSLQTFAPYDPVAEASYNTFGFNGSTEYILAPNGVCGNNVAVTISAWIRINSSTPAEGLIYAENDGTSRAAAIFRLSASNRKRLLIGGRQTSNGTFYNSETSTDVLTDDTWHFVTGIINTTNDNHKIYVDGVSVLDESSVGWSSDIVGNGLTLTANIGEYFSNNLNFLGDMSAVAIYNDELSSGENSQLYNAGKNPYYETLPTSMTSKNILYYEMSSRDDTLNDLSGGGNDGLAQGSISSDGSLQTFAAYT